MSALISAINGPVCQARQVSGFHLRDMILAGEKRLIGEVIALEGDTATLQLYEDTEGLKLGETVENSGQPLQVCLAPGMLGHIFDGIQRPLDRIWREHGAFIPEGLGLSNLDTSKEWELTFLVSPGDELAAGQAWAYVQETALIRFYLTLPPQKAGRVRRLLRQQATISEPVLELETASGQIYTLNMCQYWPVRKARPVLERLPVAEPLLTGQRVIDSFFPLAKGGSFAVPGGFGTGKTITQHQIAKWSNADIIIYIGCGERGNEMTDALAEFQKLEDPRNGQKLLERTILIANTSNMPVAAREASIYTGITMAECYRDQGYDVAIMADSTSRWAEALREIAGRLEEMPAEEGYPAYLASRLSEFYERAGRVRTLEGKTASISVIAAVSPAGGDFSEPVTENTRRCVGGFLALDRKLAYARHFPAIQWMSSYSSYTANLDSWYKEKVNLHFLDLRAKLLQILHEEDALKEIVQLVGEAALPDDQHLSLTVAKLIRVGFLQQNAFHAVDSFVPLLKQYNMMQIIDLYSEEARSALSDHIPFSVVADKELTGKIMRMKYSLGNEDTAAVEQLKEEIRQFFAKVRAEYSVVLAEGLI